MKQHAEKFPLLNLLAALLGLQPGRPTKAKPVTHKPRLRHRHSVFLELP